MPEHVKYAVFGTKWGYFGLAGTHSGLLRTHLPAPEPEKVKSRLLKGLGPAEYKKTYLMSVQEMITAYFAGTYVNFDSDIAVTLDGLSEFSQRILTACRNVKYSKTISYGQLAKKTGQPAAIRAVGAALAKNPLPLIIPCHRVIYSDGRTGGFSAAGPKRMKEKMLTHEANKVAAGEPGAVLIRGV